jgi:hypothetical protein
MFTNVSGVLQVTSIIRALMTETGSTSEILVKFH